jgi:cephalosporin hydroxylase
MKFIKNIINTSIIHEVDKLFPNYAAYIKNTKWNKFKWKNLTLMKDPMSLTTYIQLFQDIKPKTILEFGTYEGGSALFFYDTLKSLNIKTNIITFDINQKLYKNTEKEIKFIELDCNYIKEYVLKNLNFLKSLEKPVIIIEDCHVNTYNIAKYCDLFLKKDDYLIIEDTIDLDKHIILRDFLLDHNEYEIQRNYCDFWGINNSWNCNSYLKKVK